MINQLRKGLFAMQKIKINQPSFHEHLDAMRLKWGSTIVSRKSVFEFTGGALNGSTVANYDARGEGPDGRFIIGKQACYPIDNFITWLKTRCTDKRPLPVPRKRR